MHASFLLLLTLAWPQDTDEARRAIAIVRKAEGTIGFDDKLPGKPVVSINL
jgi:hypothetical protein